jgi:hypothetical protein
MTKTTLALAAALLAGTTLTTAANAGGIRVGFGFPLGSFVAHSNQSYSDGGYGGRGCDRPHHTRHRRYQAEAAPVRKVKRAPKVIARAEPKIIKTAAPIVKTAKLEDKLETNSAATTEIAKTTTTSSTTTDAAKVETVATVEKTPTNGKSDVKTVSVPAEVKQVCRRYSATIAGLVDVPCNE